MRSAGRLIVAATLGDEAKARFPRLVTALQRSAGLDEASAVNVIVEYHVFGIRNELAAPAVSRLGGQIETIRYAIRHRRAMRDLHTSTRAKTL